MGRGRQGQHGALKGILTSASGHAERPRLAFDAEARLVLADIRLAQRFPDPVLASQRIKRPIHMVLILHAHRGASFGNNHPILDRKQRNEGET